MSESFQKQLERCRVESRAEIAETRANAQPEAEALYANEQRSRRFLVIIDGHRSPVDEPETLLELANLSSAPEIN